MNDDDFSSSSSTNTSTDHNNMMLSSSSSGHTNKHLPAEIQAAYRDAKARGLPDGWSCSIDKRNRRKWTAPNGRSCDSIPKALAISVELGLLPPDTPIPTGNLVRKSNSFNNRKRKTAGKKRKRENISISRTTTGSSRTVKKKDPPAAAAAAEAAPSSKTTSTMTDKADSSTSAKGKEKQPEHPVDEEEAHEEEESDEESEEEEEERDDQAILQNPPPEDMDPEHSLLTLTHKQKKAPPTTVHWDPHDVNGRIVGWKVRVEIPSTSSSSTASNYNTMNRWLEGRVVRYDPYTHKHKILFTTGSGSSKKATINSSISTNSAGKSCWIWLRNEQHNLRLATRMVWAHVKGYAWWPALVMEPNHFEETIKKEGYVTVEFFGAGEEVATLRDSPDCIRPFGVNEIDDVVAKHKKKRNAKAFQAACEEYHLIRQCRNEAVVYYAERALEMTNQAAQQQQTNQNPNNRCLVGKRVEIHRTDVNYPYGDTVTATVRAYSFLQKKWLLSYDYSPKTRTKYDASWINVLGKKECASLRVLDDKGDRHTNNKKDLSPLIPYVVGFEDAPASASASAANTASVPAASDSSTPKKKAKLNNDNNDDNDDQVVIKSSPRQTEIATLLAERCRGCVEYWKKDDVRIECRECRAPFHVGCVDPPMSMESYYQRQRMKMSRAPASASASADDQEDDEEEGTEDAARNSDFVCSKCVSCRGCYQKDIAFGCHAKSPIPPTLSFPKGEALNLCFTCNTAYDEVRFCPNCAHSWDHEKFEKIHEQIEYAGALYRVKGKISGACGTGPIADTCLPATMGSFSGDEKLPLGAKVDPAYFHAETAEWGFSEIEMLVCDNCQIWVHAGCSGLNEDEYDLTSNGKHPIYSKEFLCRICCRNRCKELIEALQDQDGLMLFAVPVSDKMAPNYRDVIKNPVDLRTMMTKATNDEYLNYAWVRELFELMVLNALTFNRFYTAIWNEAKRYYHDCLSSVFDKLGKAAPPGKYADAVQECFKRAENEKKMEEDRVQVDETVEKKDLVAGSLAASVTLPKMRDSPPDQSSCVSFTEVKLKPLDAFYCSWMECCYICGSSGAMDTMLFCVDCGEAYHSFCANAPIHSMAEFAATGWRCPNCKICEISGDVPQDETRMLFCEMCDRAFSLDLLDPPLDSAPSGLWICGQCVDCSVCNNTAELGASLKHWSRDPKKCFRCGGCDEVVDDYMGNASCVVCKKRLRIEDSIVRCSNCTGHVHTSCHDTAKKHFSETSRAPRIATESESGDCYLCPLCCPKVEAKSDPEADFQWLCNQVLPWVSQLPAGFDDYSSAELHSKLVEQIGWEIRSLWKEEYLDILREGLRVYSLVKQSFDDARIIAQHALSGVTGLPMHIIQRALRFVFVVKRSRWDALDGNAPDRIEVVFQSAKLAAAFLKIANSVLNLQIDQTLISSDRFSRLLEAPDECGQIVFPMESLKSTEEVEESVLKLSQEESLSAVSPEVSPGTVKPKTAAPLCGWTNSSPVGADQTPVWKDPRECCLCHLCGDDDAGFLDYHTLEGKEDRNQIPLGRLLPLSDGGFVHTGCALWSSEVWEDSNEGLVNAVDKARSRGSQLKCFGCGFYGATVGCNKSNCLFNYHLPCAKYCGAAFTSNQQVFCPNHRGVATGVLEKVTFEPMKTLMIAPEKKCVEKETTDGSDGDLCSRVGSLVVHSLGTIESEVDGFHSENYITPPGFVATRIFWSSTKPRSRTLYVLKVESVNNRPQFTIIPGDSPSIRFSAPSVAQVYASLLDRVRKVNSDMFSQGDLLSKLPVVRRTRRKTLGLNGPQFFGFGLDHIRKMLETSSGVEAVVAPLSSSSAKYRFCFYQPQLEAVKDLIRKRAAAKAEKALENSSGCARTEGIKAVARSGGSGRITRALVRSAEEEVATLESGAAITKKGEEKAKTDRNLIQIKYKRMKSVPMEQRLAARRSHIHGWGLFNKGPDIPKDDPIVEYMGETIRQPIADKRERAYEISGEGSCYMFRLDLHRIVDATKIGCMARFMNHSCQPNAYAKIITVDSESGAERKIVVFANRDISSGEEITYDYKFPVEDGSLRCTCGAPNCIGRLN